MKLRVPSRLRGGLDEVAHIARDPYLVIWSLFILCFPFYFFASGLPQPAGLAVLLLPLMLLRQRREPMTGDLRAPFTLLLAFTGYVLLINLLWSVALTSFTTSLKDGFLLSPLYYLYNALLLWTFIMMYKRYGALLLWLTAHVTLVSVGIQVLIAFVTPAQQRAILQFNSPNQLGYFAILSACIILIGQRRLKLSTVKVSIGIAACSYLALISASKAALGSIAALAIVMLLNRVRTMLVVGLLLVLLMFTPNPFSDAIDNAQARIAGDEQALGLLEQRGYDRLLNNPEYCVLGAGEGAYRRFEDTTAIGAHEIHSSVGTLVFCYGIVGTALFVAFVWLVLRRQPSGTWLIFTATFAFGMAHQGLRFGLFWVVVGMALALRNLDLRERGSGELVPSPVRPTPLEPITAR